MTGSANVLTRARFKLIVFFLLAGLLVAALWPAFQSPGQPEDEGIALVYPARPRHFSLRQISLHFSWTTAAPQTGHTIRFS